MVSRFFFNHVGLEQGPLARALVARNASEPATCELITSAGWTSVRELPLTSPVPGPRGLSLSEVDLGEVPRGRYVLGYQGEQSLPFFIEPQALLGRTLSSVLDYFRSQRCAAPWDDQDRRVPFAGDREGTVDAHGGWYDASGDLSKYLSHLSYANFMNPQQTPLVVWGLLEHYERRATAHGPGIAARLLAEATHGADFLCRMQDEEGYFYMTVFDQWSKFPERRVICAYETQQGTLLDSYQAGYRQGGGLAIAALARAGRVLSQSAYLEAAMRGFEHLEEHNLKYLDDGKENVIDDYCALLASSELFRATQDESHRKAAVQRTQALLKRLRSQPPEGSALDLEAHDAAWLVADDGERPFFHASDAGLPVLALAQARPLLPEALAEEARKGAERLMRGELLLTQEVDNPFGYPRQYVQALGPRRFTSFFVPHENETGYWWQGENARLASLAAAAARVANWTQEGDEKRLLVHYAQSALDWICGKNPYDSCMLHGFGHGGRNYMPQWPNVVGGICNGITSGLDDESDLDFGRDDVEGDHSWRWFEQWLPHATWFMIALSDLNPAPAHDHPAQVSS